MKKIAVISLGCPKNLVDTENMLGILESTGKVKFTKDLRAADIILVNTCGFIEPAKKESIDEILNVIEEKKRNPNKRIVVAGCLYQRYKEEIKKGFPEVDNFIGTDEVEKVAEKLLNQKVAAFKPYLLRHVLTPPHIAYLKISEGCSNGCSFCAIPIIRGRLKSRPMDEIVDEAENLAMKGVKELYIIAEDTTAYMYDRRKKNVLVKLLRKLERIEGIKWIRLMYAYPSHVTDELIDFMAESKKMVHYIDVPFQHISDKVLLSMGRRYNRNFIEDLIKKLRKKIPDIAIRSTFIVGFPTEGEREFEELLSFVKTAKLDWVGFFKYSLEEGTRAYSLGDLVPDEVKSSRISLIEDVQYSISEEINEKLIGKKLKLIVDGKAEDMPGYVEARSYRNAHEIDGIVYLRGNYKSGSFVDARITGLASSVDLIAERVK